MAQKMTLQFSLQVQQPIHFIHIIQASFTFLKLLLEFLFYFASFNWLLSLEVASNACKA